METDEEQIHELIDTWLSASKSGDVDKLLSLMTDDVVFLVAGRAPMGKEDFAVAARAQTGPSAPKLDGSNEIQELQVLGEWAFMWTRLSVVATPLDGSPPIERAGHALTILKKENGRWLLARDANLLASVQR